MTSVRFFPLTLTVLTAPVLAQTELYTTAGEIHGAFGWSARMLPDVDNDGHADIAVGAPWADADNGRAYVLSGFDGSIVHTFFGDGFPDRLGESVAGVGDLDGDGVSDVIVGALARAGLLGKTGYARLYSGADGTVIDTVETAFPGDSFGKAVAGLGDVDLDGTPDFAVGVTQLYYAGAGEVRVYSGADRSLLFAVEGLGWADRLGHGVESAGDFDLDGAADLLAGAPEILGASVGYVIVVSGDEALQFGSFIPLSDPLVMTSDIVPLALTGDTTDGAFGSSVALLDDLSGDGTPELLIGAPFDNEVAHRAGKARLFSGTGDFVFASHKGVQEYDQLGHDVAIAGDVDGDGVRDYVLGAKQAEGWSLSPEVPKGTGYAEVRSGLDHSKLFTLAGASQSLFGFAVHGGGDVNGDGRDDFLVTAPFDDGMNGLVTVYSGVAAAEDYGSSCSAGGFQPSLSMSVSPVPAGPMKLKVEAGPPNAAASIVVGLTAGELPLGSGCSLLVAPTPKSPMALMTLDEAGAGFVDSTVPGMAGPGTTLSFQALVLDLYSATGYDTTNGCLLTVH